MRERREGGHRYCPNCRKIVETIVQTEGYSQVEYCGILAKRRLIMHGPADKVPDACGYIWYTLEIPEEVLPRLQAV